MSSGGPAVLPQTIAESCFYLFVYSPIHSFIKYLLGVFGVPSTVAGARGITETKTLPSCSLHHHGRRQ